MPTLQQIRVFRELKHRFEKLPPLKRSHLVVRFSNLRSDEASALTLREQCKIIFSVLYGARGDDLARMIRALDSGANS